jgi:hypothetical protein
MPTAAFEPASPFTLRDGLLPTIYPHELPNGVVAGRPRVDAHRRHYFNGSPNAVVMDGAEEAPNRYGIPATSS